MANSNDSSFPRRPHRNILRRLPPSLSIDSAQTPTTRPLSSSEREALATLNKLKEFLATAPSRWSPPDSPASIPFPNPNPRPALNRFSLPSNEFVTCVLWEGQYYISGTDIVRSLVFRFEAFGRPVRNMKKFEEGVFSDLRNLKHGSDASLEEPKSAFLDLLYKYQCIRTQKKQKVFFWFSVPHDRLFFDALERDIKRESMGSDPSSQVTNEPALSFRPNLSSGKTLWEEWMSRVKKLQESGELQEETDGIAYNSSVGFDSQGWAGMFELFEGSPAYKQRRKRRSPVQSRSTDENSSARRPPALVRSNSLGTTPRPSQQDLTAFRRDNQQALYPSALSNRSVPNINSSALEMTQAVYLSGMPFNASEGSHPDQSHVVRSHSLTGAHRPLFQTQENSLLTTGPRPTYNPYPRPQPRMSQNRPSSEPSTIGAVTGSAVQHQQQMLQPVPHNYASINAPYVASQSQQSLTLPINLHSTYSSTNIQSPLENTTADNSSIRAYSCPTCGKFFLRPENWRTHVNEHVALGFPNPRKDVNEFCTQVHAGQHLEDAPPRLAPPFGNSHMTSSVYTAPESGHYAAGASTMPITGSNASWSASPFSSSGSSRSNPPPSPTSSPSGSTYGQQSAQYGASSGYTHGQFQSAGYEAPRPSYLPTQPRSETPGMESRPQTASSYDSAPNPAMPGRHETSIDLGQYGRHSSAPISLSSGYTSEAYGAAHGQSSQYYNAGASYSTSPSGPTFAHESPTVEGYQQTIGHGQSLGISSDVRVGSNSGSGYAQPVYNNDSSAQWGSDYQNSPSPPAQYGSEALQQHTQQPISGALYSTTNETLRYFHAS